MESSGYLAKEKRGTSCVTSYIMHDECGKHITQTNPQTDNACNGNGLNRAQKHTRSRNDHSVNIMRFGSNLWRGRVMTGSEGYPQFYGKTTCLKFMQINQ